MKRNGILSISTTLKANKVKHKVVLASGNYQNDLAEFLFAVKDEADDECDLTEEEGGDDHLLFVFKPNTWDKYLQKHASDLKHVGTDIAKLNDLADLRSGMSNESGFVVILHVDEDDHVSYTVLPTSKGKTQWKAYQDAAEALEEEGDDEYDPETDEIED
jgi:hypothetical protein